MTNETHAKGEAELLRLACEKFVATFDRNPVVGACAPGRVNLIGDHIDYCEGYVLPVALPFLIVIVGGYNDSQECRLWTRLETGKVLETKFQAPTSKSPLKPGDPAWANYVKGVVANFPGTVNGFDAVIMSDVPMGAGLSSSAAIEVATFSFLEALTSTQVDPIKRAQLCQKAEHEFPGMPCGIMDQYISSLGKKNHALLIDCRSLESKQIPLDIGDAVIMVINSNVKHKLTGSEYPQRRAQCQEAADKLGLPSLRSATPEHLQVLRDMDCDELVLKRAEHVINEIDYTLQVAGSLSKKDLNRAGEIMYKSHESLSKLMEVSCPELDELVQIIKSCSGVYGARMSGGGFGGCAVALVKNSHVNEVKSKVLSEYAGNPFFFTCQGDDGARILKL